MVSKRNQRIKSRKETHFYKMRKTNNDKARSPYKVK